MASFHTQQQYAQQQYAAQQQYLQHLMQRSSARQFTPRKKSSYKARKPRTSDPGVFPPRKFSTVYKSFYKEESCAVSLITSSPPSSPHILSHAPPHASSRTSPHISPQPPHSSSPKFQPLPPIRSSSDLLKPLPSLSPKPPSPVLYEDIKAIYMKIRDSIVNIYTPATSYNIREDHDNKGVQFRISNPDNTDVYVLLWLASPETYNSICITNPIEEFSSDVLFLSMNRNYHRVFSNEIPTYCISYRIYPRMPSSSETLNVVTMTFDEVIKKFLNIGAISNFTIGETEWITAEDNYYSNNTNIVVIKA
jgi:hypothetical protein